MSSWIVPGWKLRSFLQGFKIESMEDIETLGQYCRYVFIEETEAGWLEAEQRALGQKKSQHKVYRNTATNAQEFYNASVAHDAARNLTPQLHGRRPSRPGH